MAERMVNGDPTAKAEAVWNEKAREWNKQFD
jgi:hypothetical protein